MSDLFSEIDVDDDTDSNDEADLRAALLAAHEKGKLAGERAAAQSVFAEFGRAMAAQLLPGVVKAFDESKIKRDHGKFAAKPGAGAEPKAGHSVHHADDHAGSYLHKNAQGDPETPMPDEATRKGIVADLAPAIAKAWKNEIAGSLHAEDYLTLPDVVEYIRRESPPGTSTLAIQAALFQLAKDRKLQLAPLNEVQTLDTPRKQAEGAIWQNGKPLGFVMSGQRGSTGIDLSGYEAGAPAAPTPAAPSQPAAAKPAPEPAPAEPAAAPKPAKSQSVDTMSREELTKIGTKLGIDKIGTLNTSKLRAAIVAATKGIDFDEDDDTPPDPHAALLLAALDHRIRQLESDTDDDGGEHLLALWDDPDSLASLLSEATAGEPAVTKAVSWAIFKAWSEAQHRRNHGQFSATGGAGKASSPSRPAPSHDADDAVPTAADVPRSVLTRVSAWVKSRHDKLAARYGPKAAKAILGAMVLLAPTPIPGSSLLPVAIAEAIKRLRALGGSVEKAEDELDDDAIHAEALALLRELYEEMGEELPDELGTVEKAWESHLHPRDDGGRFVSREAIHAAKTDPKKAAQLRERVTDPEEREKLDAAISGKTDTGRTVAGARREASATTRARKQSNRDAARKLAGELMLLPGDATPEKYHELARLIQSGDMRADELRAIRLKLAASFGGGRRTEEMVKALLAHVAEKASPLSGDEPAIPVGSVPSRKADAALNAVRQAIESGEGVHALTNLYGRALAANAGLPEKERQAHLDKLRGLFPDDTKGAAPLTADDDEHEPEVAASGPLFSEADKALAEKRRAKAKPQAAEATEAEVPAAAVESPAVAPPVEPAAPAVASVPTAEPRTREEFITSEIARLRQEYPGNDDESYQAQAESNAADWKAPDSRAYNVGQTVSYGGEPAEYRGQSDGPDGKRYAVLLVDNGRGGRSQTSVPIDDVMPHKVEWTPVGTGDVPTAIPSSPKSVKEARRADKRRKSEEASRRPEPVANYTPEDLARMEAEDRAADVKTAPAVASVPEGAPTAAPAKAPHEMTKGDFEASAMDGRASAEKLDSIRAGDKRSKNAGDLRKVNAERPHAHVDLPLDSLSPEEIKHLRESTNPERVKQYVGEKIDTPIHATPKRKGGGFQINDGGHRIVAAIDRGDKTVPAMVPADSHKALVADALASGKSVPPEVLADYPDLAAKHAAAAEPATPPSESPASASVPSPAPADIVRKTISDAIGRGDRKDALGRHNVHVAELRQALDAAGVKGRKEQEEAIFEATHRDPTKRGKGGLTQLARDLKNPDAKSLAGAEITGLTNHDSLSHVQIPDEHASSWAQGGESASVPSSPSREPEPAPASAAVPASATPAAAAPPPQKLSARAFEGRADDHAPTDDEFAAASRPAAKPAPKPAEAAVPAPTPTAPAVDVAEVYDRAGSTAKHSEVNAAARAAAGMTRAEATATLSKMGYPATGDPRKQLAELILDRKGSQLRRLSSGAGEAVDAAHREAYAPLHDEPLLSSADVLPAPPVKAKPTAAPAPVKAEKPSAPPAEPPHTDAGRAVASVYDRAAAATDADIQSARDRLAAMPAAEVQRVGAALGMAGGVTKKAVLARIEDRRGTAIRAKLTRRPAPTNSKSPLDTATLVGNTTPVPSAVGGEPREGTTMTTKPEAAPQAPAAASVPEAAKPARREVKKGDRVSMPYSSSNGVSVLHGTVEQGRGGKMFVRTDAVNHGANAAWMGGDIASVRRPLTGDWMHADDYKDIQSRRQAKKDAAATAETDKANREKAAQRQSYESAVAAGHVPATAENVKPGAVLVSHHRGIPTEREITSIDPKFGPLYRDDFGGESTMGNDLSAYTVKPA